LGGHWDVVGQHFSRTTQAFHGFTYINNASSEQGVGFCVAGDYGSFSQSGTSCQDTSGSIKSPPA
jgi:hypothetical protein